MGQKRRKWSGSEKLQIIQDAELKGTAEASRIHGVSSSMIYRWSNQYREQGSAGLMKTKSPVDEEKKELALENERLRQVVADQALTIRIKNELLKKTRSR